MSESDDKQLGMLVMFELNARLIAKCGFIHSTKVINPYVIATEKLCLKTFLRAEKAAKARPVSEIYSVSS